MSARRKLAPVLGCLCALLLSGCVDPQEIETLKSNQLRLIQSFDRIERKLDRLSQGAKPKAPGRTRRGCPLNADPLDLNSLGLEQTLKALDDRCSGLSCTLARKDSTEATFSLHWGAQQKTLTLPISQAGPLMSRCNVFR